MMRRLFSNDHLNLFMIDDEIDVLGVQCLLVTVEKRLLLLFYQTGF